jgi:zinc transporter 1/2/3
MSDLWLPRLICILLCFALAMVGYSLSLWLKGSPRFFEIGNALSAGVMLSAGLVHLLNDANSSMDKYLKNSDQEDVEFPFVPMLAGCSFLSLILFENFMKNFIQKRSKKNKTENISNIEDCPSEATNTVEGVSRENSDEIIPSNLPKVQALIVSLAMNFHAVMEGFGMGSSQKVESIWKILIAIATHKGLEAFAVGSAILKSKVSNFIFWIYGTIFALCTPLGIGIGWLSSTFSSEKNLNVETDESLGTIICNSLAAGTFLWVACMEFLPHVFENQDNLILKTVSLVVGYGAMSVLAIWA